MLISCRGASGKFLAPLMRKWVMLAICTSIFHLASLPGFPEHQEEQVCLPQKSDMTMQGWPRNPQNLSSNRPMHPHHLLWDILDRYWQTSETLTEPRARQGRSAIQQLVSTVARTSSANGRKAAMGWLAGRSVSPTANLPKKPASSKELSRYGYSYGWCSGVLSGNFAFRGRTEGSHIMLLSEICF